MTDEFTTDGYRRHNACRLEHLESLKLPIHGKTVLELGAGIGDHTQFFLDKNCLVTCVEGRRENLDRIRKRHGGSKVRTVLLDFEYESSPVTLAADIVVAYGILYHLDRPLAFLEEWARRCGELMIVETCVSRNPGGIEYVSDDTGITASLHGHGCRPSRRAVLCTLQALFSCAYACQTQPNHEEFPLDWNCLPADGLIRAVFIGSRIPLNNPLLSHTLPARYAPC